MCGTLLSSPTKPPPTSNKPTANATHRDGVRDGVMAVSDPFAERQSSAAAAALLDLDVTKNEHRGRRLLQRLVRLDSTSNAAAPYCCRRARHVIQSSGSKASTHNHGKYFA